MSLIIACKPAYSLHESDSQTYHIKALPTFQFMHPLPKSMRQDLDDQTVKWRHITIQSMKLTATLVGDHRAQAIVSNKHNQQVTLRPDDQVGQHHWRVEHISSKQVKLSQSSGQHYVLQLS